MLVYLRNPGGAAAISGTVLAATRNVRRACTVSAFVFAAASRSQRSQHDSKNGRAFQNPDRCRGDDGDGQHERGGRRSGYIALWSPPARRWFGFQMYASRGQGTPAGSRLDRSRGGVSSNIKAHCALQPIALLLPPKARLDARTHGSHHSPRAAITAKILLCLLRCRPVKVSPARLARPAQQASPERVHYRICG